MASTNPRVNKLKKITNKSLFVYTSYVICDAKVLILCCGCVLTSVPIEIIFIDEQYIK